MLSISIHIYKLIQKMIISLPKTPSWAYEKLLQFHPNPIYLSRVCMVKERNYLPAVKKNSCMHN